MMGHFITTEIWSNDQWKPVIINAHGDATMAIFTIDSLQSAADAYIAQPSAELFMAVEEWIAHSYEQGGDYTEEQLEQMDFKSAAEQFIQRRREQS